MSSPVARGSVAGPDALWRRSVAGIASLMFAIAAALFLPAWTVRWWRAWAYWLVFLAAVVVVTVHFLRRDPDLVRRRLAAGPSAEQRWTQKIVQAFASVLFVAVFVLSGLDRHFGWSSVPALVSLIADAVVAGSFAIVFLVFGENTHASATIQVSADQRVISTGPYRHVRHPMYTGGLLLVAATPLALGSLVALALVPPFAAVLVARLMDEERVLAAELGGYREYRRRVRYRLLPRVW